MNAKRCVSDLRGDEWEGKTALVILDLDMPVGENLKKIKYMKIVDACTMIKFLIIQGAKVIACGYWGHPNGVNPNYSFKLLEPELSELTGVKVKIANHCIGEGVDKLIAETPVGGVVLLENLRFYEEEEKNDPAFAEKIASNADLFIIEAFAIAHEFYASTVGVPKFSKTCVGGFRFMQDVEFFSGRTDKPVVGIVGGQELSEAKFNTIESTLEIADILLLGGTMTKSFGVGSYSDTIVGEDEIKRAESVICKAKVKGVRILFPVDAIIADSFSDDANFKVVPAAHEIPNGWKVAGIGPETIKMFTEECKTGKTIFWNGLIGISEFDTNGPTGILKLDEFATAADKKIANTLGNLSVNGVITIIGGDDTIAAMENFGVHEQMIHISTGFDAGLEILAGKQLPAVTALDDL